MLRSELRAALMKLADALLAEGVGQSLKSLRMMGRGQAPRDDFDFSSILKVALDLAEVGHQFTGLQQSIAEALSLADLFSKDWWVERLRLAGISSKDKGGRQVDAPLWDADLRMNWLVPALPIIALMIDDADAESQLSEEESQFAILFPDGVEVSATRLSNALEAVEELSNLYAIAEGNHPEAIVVRRLDSGSDKLLELGSRAVTSLVKAGKLIKEVAFKLALLPQRQAMAQIEVIARSTETVAGIEAQVQRGNLTREQADNFCIAVNDTLSKYFATGATVPGATRSEQILALPEPEPIRLLEGPKNTEIPNEDEEQTSKGNNNKAPSRPKRAPKKTKRKTKKNVDRSSSRT